MGIKEKTNKQENNFVGDNDGNVAIKKKTSN